MAKQEFGKLSYTFKSYLSKYLELPLELEFYPSNHSMDDMRIIKSKFTFLMEARKYNITLNNV